MRLWKVLSAQNRNALIFGIIYLLTLAFMLNYNFTHPVINDGVYEYHGYMLNIADGWQYRYSAINSSLVSIWFPAMLQKMTGIDPLILYRVFPPFFYALTPAFTYIISRKYFGIRDSVVATLLVACSSYILFFPDIGRVGVALGVLAGLIWALLSKKLLTSVVFSFLLVFAHYATPLIAIGLVLVILVGRLLWDRINVRVTAAALCTLILFTGGWHFGIAHYSGDSMLWTLLHPGEARGILEDYIPGVRVDVPQGGFLELKSRDYVTQEAFGRHFATNSTPLKIEVAINWIVVGLITLGLSLTLKNKSIDKIFKVVLIALYGLTTASVIIPSISVFYGTQRVYFTSLIVLAACFPVGTKWLAEKIHLPALSVSLAVLLVYGATTSGLTYTLFGLTKSVPVILRLP